MRKLRLYFLGFFVLLAAPFAILLMRTYGNLEQEAFFFYRRAAEGAGRTLSQQLVRILESEARRPYNQYRYLHVPDQPVPKQEGLNISPLAAYPVSGEIPGMLGYFQIDPDGSFHTPLLPDDQSGSYPGVPQRQARQQLRDRLADLLKQHQPWSVSAGQLAEERQDLDAIPPSKNYLDRLDRSLEQRYDLKESAASSASATPQEAREGVRESKRQVQKSTPQQALIFDSELDRPALGQSLRMRENEAQDTYRTEEAASPSRKQQARNAKLLDSAQIESADDAVSGQEVTAEVDPFQVDLEDGQWLVFHRKVWWQERRYVQGFVARAGEFFETLLDPAVRNSALPENAAHLVFYRSQLLTPAPPAAGREHALRSLWESSLPSSFSDFRVAFAVEDLPYGPGYSLVNATAVFLTLILIAGSFGMYRLTASQIELSQKKSDFVSAVSHELKTPLASIRMYGEMLVEGWVADEQKRQSYYRHIHDESERLSRLIQNVLRLSELERKEWQVDLSAQDPAALVRQAVDRFGRQAQLAGFELTTIVTGQPQPIQTDQDALTQILVNLIDNAIKFSKDAEIKKVELKVEQQGDVCSIRVRDYGPGIPRGKRLRIFDKFYRIDNEMTRATRGTGIGLALVRMLAEAMGATVEARNQRPGAEFIVRFPATAAGRPLNSS